MLIIRCWRNWLRLRDLCQPPLLSQNLQQRCLGVFLTVLFATKKLLSQNLNSLQTKVDFDEPSDFKMF